MNINEIHKRMGIPPAYQGKLLEQFDNRDKLIHVAGIVREFAVNKKNLIICSPTSEVGKTMLAVIWLTTLRQNDFYFNVYDDPNEKLYPKPDRYRFVDCTDQIDFDTNDFREAPAIYRQITKGARAIVLDDLGREGRLAPDWYMKIIYKAHSGRIPMCITTNLPPDKLTERYEYNVIRRVDDNGKNILDLTQQAT